MFAEKQSIDAPISIYEAMARAIRYNLDFRAKLLDQAIQQEVANVAGWDLLPKMAASAGYVTRSSENSSTSLDTVSGLQSANPSVSQPRSQQTGNLSLTWNVLDFGVSYIRGRQQSDRALIAEERRRKAVQTIIQDVRSAYWRAVTAEKLSDDLNRMSIRIREALTNARQIEEQRLQPAAQVLEFQKTLLDIQRQLQLLSREVATARTELSGLMNLEPGQKFSLVIPPESDMKVTIFPPQIEKIERYALLHRPELREEDYKARISADDTKAELLRLLPGIEFNTSHLFDSNQFLTNNTWAEAGMKLTWNLMNLVSAPSRIGLSENNEELAKQRRLALSMVVITQVHIAFRRLIAAEDEYHTATEMSDVDERLYQQAVAGTAASTQPELEMIRRDAGRIFSRSRQNMAFTELKNAIGALYLTSGADPLPAVISSPDVATLAKSLEDILGYWERNGQLMEEGGAVPSAPPPDPTLAGATTNQLGTENIASPESQVSAELAPAPAPPVIKIPLEDVKNVVTKLPSGYFAHLGSFKTEIGRHDEWKDLKQYYGALFASKYPTAVPVDLPFGHFTRQGVMFPTKPAAVTFCKDLKRIKKWWCWVIAVP